MMISRVSKAYQSSMGLVFALRFIGWANLLASIFVAIYIWASFTTAEVVTGTYYPRTEKGINYVAVGAGVGVIVQSIIVLVLFLAIAQILEHVTDMRVDWWEKEREENG